MITRSFSVLFYLKRRSGQPIEEWPIYLRITTNCASKELSLQRKCHPDNWNNAAGRVIGKTEKVKLLNAYLDTIEAKVHEAKHQLLEKDKPVTSSILKNMLQGQEAPGERHMLLEVFKHHNDQMAALVGREYAAGTLVRFNSALKHTGDFILWKYKVADLDVKKLNYEFITEFEFWFKTVKNCCHNTTIKYIACCKKMVLTCMKHGWLERDPFMNFNMALREVERVALTDQELQTMTTKEFSSDRLRNVRDIFVFSCFTGLAYSDIKKLRRSEISTGIDGEKWIFTKRKKTDTASRIPVLPVALEILKRYDDHPVCQIKGLALPILTNQKMNEYLKEIADVCDLNKNLTFHIARHTFATTVTLSNGVPIETVSKMLGHRNLKTTQHYAKILDKKVSQDMQALKEKLSLKLPGN